MTAEGYWDRQYNPRLSVAAAAEYFANWNRRASEARASTQPIELTYGEHPREKLDLFRAPNAKGTLVFIHGGYWRAFSKHEFSWLAPPFLAAGVTVAVLSYPLCPEVALSRISIAIDAAMNYLTQSVLNAAERRRLVLSGHSVGAHLAARYQSSRRPGQPAHAIVCISGLFDLLPLKHTHMLASLDFQESELHAASPLFAPPPATGDVLLAVGAEEPPEFAWQSARLASAWSDRQPQLMTVAGRNHFSVVEALAEPGHALFNETLGYFR